VNVHWKRGCEEVFVVTCDSELEFGVRSMQEESYVKADRS
jgi:hypothetical protein